MLTLPSVIVASVMRMIALNPASKVAASDMSCESNHWLSLVLLAWAVLTFVPPDLISESNSFLWTQVEACVGVICACLPTLKGPLKQFFPDLLSIKGRSTRNAYDLNALGKDGGSAGWKESAMYSSRASAKRDTDVDDASSQERIIGITKTVDVHIMEEGRGSTPSGKESFRF